MDHTSVAKILNLIAGKRVDTASKIKPGQGWAANAGPETGWMSSTLDPKRE